MVAGSEARPEAFCIGACRVTCRGRLAELARERKKGGIAPGSRTPAAALSRTVHPMRAVSAAPARYSLGACIRSWAQPPLQPSKRHRPRSDSLWCWAVHFGPGRDCRARRCAQKRASSHTARSNSVHRHAQPRNPLSPPSRTARRDLLRGTGRQGQSRAPSAAHTRRGRLQADPRAAPIGGRFAPSSRRGTHCRRGGWDSPSNTPTCVLCARPRPRNAKRVAHKEDGARDRATARDLSPRRALQEASCGEHEHATTLFGCLPRPVLRRQQRRQSAVFGDTAGTVPSHQLEHHTQPIDSGTIRGPQGRRHARAAERLHLRVAFFMALLPQRRPFCLECIVAAALLAATDGILPRALEHTSLARGIPRGVGVHCRA
eukprot:scaffold53868_cov66-Phaeocystis_antarctica.AAC.2